MYLIFVNICLWSKWAMACYSCGKKIAKSYCLMSVK